MSTKLKNVYEKGGGSKFPKKWLPLLAKNSFHQYSHCNFGRKEVQSCKTCKYTLQSKSHMKSTDEKRYTVKMYNLFLSICSALQMSKTWKDVIEFKHV